MAAQDKVVPYIVWDSNEGTTFDCGIYRCITSIDLWIGSNFVQSIAIHGELNDGSSSRSSSLPPERSTSTHGNREKVDLIDGETLLGISGHWNKYRTDSVVTCLSFHTSNGKVHGPYGKKKGTPFECFIPAGENGEHIVGLFGHRSLKAPDALCGIGVYYQLAVPRFEQGQPTVLSDLVACYDKLVNFFQSWEWRPWPSLKWHCQGKGGIPWDDGIHRGICQIEISHGRAVDSIRVQYQNKHGRAIWANSHGKNIHSNNTQKTEQLKLDYPNEYVVSMKGTYNMLAPQVVLRSITFQTNLKTLGPFGRPSGFRFESPQSGYKILGFFGRSGDFVDAIGVHLAILDATNLKPKTDEPQLQEGFMQFVSRLKLQEKVKCLEPDTHELREEESC